MNANTIHVPPEYPSVPNRAKIAFVGEAPGDEELKFRTPLVGPAGRRFNTVLRTAGISRDEHFITNVFDEKLPDNDLANWCDLRSAQPGDLPNVGKLGYLRSEYHWHLERLAKEIADADANIIVPMGATALWAFTGLSTISNFRGSIMAATLVSPGAKLLPTVHPMAIEHQWKWFTITALDFVKAYNEAQRGKQIVLPQRRLLVEPSIADLQEYLPKLLASPLLSTDIETGWGQITTIGFAPSEEEAISIPFLDKRQVDRNYWRTMEEEVQALGIVKQVVESDTPKLGQNFGGYDAMWLLRKWGMKPYNFLHDTRLMHHALYPELEKSLEFMASSYSSQGAWKHWSKNKFNEKRDD